MLRRYVDDDGTEYRMDMSFVYNDNRWRWFVFKGFNEPGKIPAFWCSIKLTSQKKSGKL